MPSLVVVFEPLPRSISLPLKAPARIMSFGKFFAMRAGVDRFAALRFQRKPARAMSAQQFLDDIFVAGLGVRYVV